MVLLYLIHPEPNTTDITLIQQDVAAKLNLDKTSTNLQITTYDGCKKSVNAAIVNFDVISRDEKRKFHVRRAYEGENLYVSPNPRLEDLPMESWPHLKGLKFPDVGQEEVTTSWIRCSNCAFV